MTDLDQKTQAIRQHSAQAEQFARRYESLALDPYATCFAYSRWRLEASLGRDLAGPGDGRTVLDLGCGTGHHMAQLRERGFAVSGVDGSADMVRLARERNPDARIECCDVESTPFGSGSFDIVLAIEVLRYLPSLAPVASEMARLLRPGGICLATAAPRFNLNGYWVVNRLASTIPVPGLVGLRQYFTSAGQLRRVFAQAGFCHSTVDAVYLGPINWVERIAASRLRGFLRWWEPLDRRFTGRPALRELANMFLLRAVRDDRPAMGVPAS